MNSTDLLFRLPHGSGLLPWFSDLTISIFGCLFISIHFIHMGVTENVERTSQWPCWWGWWPRHIKKGRGRHHERLILPDLPVRKMRMVRIQGSQVMRRKPVKSRIEPLCFVAFLVLSHLSILGLVHYFNPENIQLHFKASLSCWDPVVYSRMPVRHSDYQIANFKQ